MHLKRACASPPDQRTVARSQFLLPKHRPAAFPERRVRYDDTRRDTATGRQLENFSRVHRECSLRFCARRNGRRGAPLTLPFAGSGHNRQTRTCYSNPLRARCLREPPASSCNSSAPSQSAPRLQRGQQQQPEFRSTAAHRIIARRSFDTGSQQWTVRGS